MMNLNDAIIVRSAAEDVTIINEEDSNSFKCLCGQTISATVSGITITGNIMHLAPNTDATKCPKCGLPIMFKTGGDHTSS